MPVPTPIELKPAYSYTKAQGKGVVLIIAPWNYPVTLALSPLAAALSAGCCAVIKPSEVTPRCSAVIKKLCEKYLDPRAGE